MLRAMLGDSRRPRILFPRDGMIFYAEEGAGQDGTGQDRTGEDGRAIPGWIAADPEDRITLRLNGRILEPDDPARPLLPVQPGRYRLAVRGSFGEDTITYTVR